MFGNKSTFGSVEAAVHDAFDEQTTNNCATIRFEGPDDSLTVQLLRQETDLHMLNVCGINNETIPPAVRQAIDLPVEDSGDMFIVFGSDAESVDAGVEQILAVGEVINAGREHVTKSKCYRAGTGDFWTDFRALVPFADA